MYIYFSGHQNAFTDTSGSGNLNEKSRNRPTTVFYVDIALKVCSLM